MLKKENTNLNKITWKVFRVQIHPSQKHKKKREKNIG